jgi:hypothetical protein
LPNRSWTAAELHILVAGLLQSNPEGTVFFTRGNHDDVNSIEHSKGFQRELQMKFSDEFKRTGKSYAASFNLVSQQKINHIGQLYRQPLCLFVGVRTFQKGDAEEILYHQLFHAAPDFRYNPKKLFAALHRAKEDNKVFYERYPIHFEDGTNPKVEQLLNEADKAVADAFKNIKQRDVTELQYATFTSGYMLDQKDDANTPCRLEDTGNKISVGKGLWEAFLEDYRYEYKPYSVQKFTRAYLPTFTHYHMLKWFWGRREARESYSSVICAMSGHQHLSSGTYNTVGQKKPNIMDRLWLGHGCTQLWTDDAETFDIPEIRSIAKGGFYKLAPFCNNIYGISNASPEANKYPGFNWGAITTVTLRGLDSKLTTTQVPIFPQEKRSIDLGSREFVPQLDFPGEL